MRRVLAVVLVFLAACSADSDSGSTEPSVTTSTSASTSTLLTTTTSTLPATTTTAAPSTTTTITPLQGLAYDEVGTLPFPIHMVPQTDQRSLIATKDGQIYAFDGQSIGAEPLLDISGRVRNSGEQGLLAVAVDPNDTSRLFIHYSANDGDTVVEEYTIDQTGQISPDPVRQLLRLDQPASNHNGGMLQVDPAGNLYIGLGDGGGANDRFGHGQNRDTLLGGLVRIDPDDPDASTELFQYGLRNPWRFWIDDDLIYISDVGQNAFEEVSVATLARDVNYGWSITEGMGCFRSGCDTSGLTLPAIELRHGDAGTCSIIGGHVYRGGLIPEIDGHYFYSDLCGGYLRSFRYSDGVAVEETDWTDQVGRVGSVVSFGLDHEGEMYVLTSERVLRVVPVR